MPLCTVSLNRKRGLKMTVLAKIKINNCPELIGGYEVVTNDEGNLWHYGLYESKDKAEYAVNENESRFMIEVLGSEADCE